MIAQLNPGVSLPSTKITPVYRSDGSGDTYAFTNYLSTVSPEFKAQVGTSTTVKFPTGVGAEKNDGVAAAISQTDGAIGYVGLAYALSNELSMPLVENLAAKFPKPGVKSVEAAAKAVTKIGPNNEISLADLPASAKNAYPISTYTYVIVPLESEKAEALKKFITYAIGPGQEYGPDLDFAPLPKQVVAADKKAIAKIGGRVRRNLTDRIGDPLLRGLSGLAAALAVAVIAGIAYEVVHLAWPAITKFGVGFVTTNDWNPVTERYGAAPFIYGTAVTSAIALLFAAPLSIAISIYLTELAPSRVRRPVATLVDMLAAIPSVILGLWGILVLGPFMHDTIEPALNSVLGFLPIFSGDPSAFGYLTAALILTIMTTPIITSVTREVFETVPGDLKEGSYALGATRWEMIRQVVLPYSRAGIVGATILGLGRAIGEAIAVAQVIGGATGINVSLFHTGSTMAAQIAAQFQGAPGALQKPSLAYLGLILLVFAVIVNVVARLIVQRGTLKDTDMTVTEAGAL